ncbi:hypothetical protein KDK77_00505 [bacterium]|nr:hypothetical protein [bacterium]MCP5462289.1 hypothetical protein [bacterium]
MKFKIALFISIMVLVHGRIARAENEVPADLATAIMLKALNYDRSLEARSGDTVTIGIFFSDEIHQKKYAHEMYRGINKHKSDGKLSVRSLPVDVKMIDKDDIRPFTQQTLVEKFKEWRISVLFIVLSDGKTVDDLITVTTLLKINSFCLEKHFLKHGATIAIIENDNKPQLFINLDASKNEGSDYSGKFLSICEKMQ